MAQATILASGTSEATSTNVVIAAGEAVTVGAFPGTTGNIPSGVAFTVMQDTPGGDNYVARLTNQDRSTVLAAPGTYRVTRPAYTGDAFGVFTES